jgi:hypothetical protein
VGAAIEEAGRVGTVGPGRDVVVSDTTASTDLDGGVHVVVFTWWCSRGGVHAVMFIR